MGKGRAPCCDKTQVKRGPWSPEEDLKLIAFIQKHGHENWRSLPKQAGIYFDPSLSLSVCVCAHWDKVCQHVLFFCFHIFSRSELGCFGCELNFV